MRTGRPRSERQAVISWLEIFLSKGMIKVEEVRAGTPASWCTTVRAKKDLGVRSKRIKTDIFWYLPLNGEEDVPEPSAPRDMNQVVDVNDEPEESDGIQLDVKGIVNLVQEMILDNKELPAIEREVLLSCAQWPMPKPYSREYILRIVRASHEGDTVPGEFV